MIMKSFSFLFLFLFATFIAVGQTNDRFQKAMENIVTQLDTTRNAVVFQDLANRLERLTQAEKEQWLPPYYLAYVRMQQATQALESNNTMQASMLVEQAQQALDQAKTRTDYNSELAAVQGYIYIGRIWDDPMTNGAKYSPMAQQTFQQAIELDAKNPRAYALQGMIVLYTPVFYGGGPKAAMPMLEKAQALFAEAQPEALQPRWGTGMNEWLLQQAKAQLAEEDKK